ncbi:hypothetical protein [Kitasatospora phosalacinea]|uniref:Uncharacterized protein n=1 Tax=Kitasatospora phosalacinea TaxID=2065 RepID=A0A9W6PML1_9ACTN|nr:hypothetical protein [Kitasatospora phosalacinea]GLW57623.1 hypothetical protein Kpho01_56340 [Kitasatospora phosalacinea]
MSPPAAPLDGSALPGTPVHRDAAAHREARAVLLHRADRETVPAHSLAPEQLRGPCGPFPRADGRAAARALVARTLHPPRRRHG